jgi:O-antigen ligase
MIAFGTIIFGAFMAFVGTLQRLASPDAIYGLREPNQAIPFGPFVNQHHFAAFIEMTGAMAAAFLISRSLKAEKKMLLAIAAVIMALACVLTSSRGGLACLVVGVLVVGLISRTTAGNESRESGSGRTTIVLAGVGFAVVVVALVVFVGGDQSLLRGIGLDNPTGDLTNGRLHFWSVALIIFAANPILGAGLDAFGVAFTQHDTWNGTFRVEQAHNEYLQILAEGGILGLVAVLSFVAMFLRLGIMNVRNTVDPFLRTCAIGAFGGCVAVLLHSTVDFPLRTPSNAFVFLLLVTVATMTSKIPVRSH